MEKGLSGLANLGNTCFINSCMQVLSHCQELNDVLDNVSYKKRLNATKFETVLLLEWDDLRKLLWSQNCIVAPHKFIRTIRQLATLKKNELLTGTAQNDVHEFLIFLLDSFHEALKREVSMTITGDIGSETDKLAVKCYEMTRESFTKAYSEIWRMFYGIQVSQIVSSSSSSSKEEDRGILRSKPEAFSVIDLSIPVLHSKTVTLHDCFTHYISGERLEGDNAWFNDETGQAETLVEKKLSFWSLPQILIVDLKRFNAKNQKNQTFVLFPIDGLDLAEFVIGYKPETYVYDLFGICNHSGTVHGGHYTAYVKTKENNWFHFNDTSVTRIIDKDNIVSNSAYCFFYRKRTSSSVPAHDATAGAV